MKFEWFKIGFNIVSVDNKENSELICPTFLHFW